MKRPLSHFFPLLLFAALLLVGQPGIGQPGSGTAPQMDSVILSLFGDTLTVPDAGATVLYRADTVTANYIDQLIWYGRFNAYKGAYHKAIEIYSRGIEEFPDEPRLYRHRGHRFITIRKYEQAIDDFEKAALLIANTENEIEPDGMPNAQNIPVSTLHGNIWYHLGLSYYLTQNWAKAEHAFNSCLSATQNDDNIVSATHWLYMIARRTGNEEKANAYLAPIREEMTIIENHAYHRICLFYKGLLPLEELQGDKGVASSNDAVNYAIGNWYFYSGDRSKALDTYHQITRKSSWNSFGYIAAEADLYHEFNER